MQNQNHFLINSHAGRDYFSLVQNLELIDIASEFSEKSGITVVHETHRVRMGYIPQITEQIFRVNKNFMITADFSHWECVTESFLENFLEILSEAIRRTKHIHTRIGFEEGPQVPIQGLRNGNMQWTIFLAGGIELLV